MQNIAGFFQSLKDSFYTYQHGRAVDNSREWELHLNSHEVRSNERDCSC